MIELKHIVLILIAHFVADFCLQPRKIAETKSEKISALCIHGIYYLIGTTVSLFLFMITGILRAKEIPIDPLLSIIKFLIINAVFHIIIDFVTSKISAYFYKKQMIRQFFIVIGADQVIHIIILIYSFSWFVTNPF